MGFLLKRLLLVLGCCLPALTGYAQMGDLKVDGKAESIALPGDTLVDGAKRAALFLRIDSDLDSLEFDTDLAPLQRSARTGSTYLWLSPVLTSVTVRRAGYLPLTISLEERGVSYEKGLAWKLRITPEDQYATINFLVKPDDAMLTLDGRKTTRTKGLRLAHGRHRVVLEKPGFKKIDRTLFVDASTTLYELSLQPLELQAVTVRSEPPGARFYLDDIEKGLTDKGLFLYPGKYRVKLVRSGYLDAERELVVRENEPSELMVNLKKNTGLLLWTTEPSHTKVLVNREDMTGRYATDLAPGKYMVELSAPGYDSYVETVEIRLGEETRRQFRLKQQTGVLQINVNPVETEFELVRDGWLVKRAYGTNMVKDLPAGTYTAVAWARGWQQEARTFTIAHESTSIMDIRLKKETVLTPPAAEVTSSALNARFVLVEPGTFPMGGDLGSPDEKPVHNVTIGRPFYIGLTEVTQGQWKAVMGSLPTVPLADDDLPVGGISYSDALEFINRLNQKESGSRYRLPTEAEWEYACGAGISDEQSLGEYAWHNGNAGGRLQRAASRKPNARGIFDMQGNVWEWTSDWYSAEYYAGSPTRDPQGPASGLGRVMRGGSVLNPPKNTRATYRLSANPDLKNFNYGFRLVRQWP